MATDHLEPWGSIARWDFLLACPPPAAIPSDSEAWAQAPLTADSVEASVVVPAKADPVSGAVDLAEEVVAEVAAVVDAEEAAAVAVEIRTAAEDLTTASSRASAIAAANSLPIPDRYLSRSKTRR